MGNKRKLNDQDRSDIKSIRRRSGDVKKPPDYLSLNVKREVIHDNSYNFPPNPATGGASICGSGLIPKAPVVVQQQPSKKQRILEHRQFCDDCGFEEYRDDIFRYKLTIEQNFPKQSLKNQPQMNELLRAILVRWITEIHHKLNLSEETLFLAVNIIDRFLARMVIIPESLQMIGLTSLFIASKYEEISPPDMNELLVFTELTKMHHILMKRLESIILKTLSFSLNHPSTLYFIEYYAVICIQNSDPSDITKLKKSLSFSRLLLELFLQDYQLCQFKPSLLSLCTWLLSISENGQKESYNFLFPKEQQDKIMFEDCFNKVKQQISKLRRQYANLDNFCDYYNSI